jgi:hypothetical protein
MSDLEIAAKPLLIPMIFGRRQTLDRPQQRTLAAWAYKTATIGEQMEPETAVMPPEHRAWIRDQGEPHPAVRVFISATDARWGSDTQYSDSKLGVLLPRPRDGYAPGEYKGYVATLVIRHLALQVTGSPFEKADFVHKAPLSGSVQRIWPFVRSFRWPSGPILAPDALQAFVTHWDTPGQSLPPM